MSNAEGEEKSRTLEPPIVTKPPAQTTETGYGRLGSRSGQARPKRKLATRHDKDIVESQSLLAG